jgi:SagB-type dehydrogenase family enzyme
MKPPWITLPIVALAVFVLARALLRRPVARHTLNVVVALYLLGYLLATAMLGLFWVARMDLPAFDLHYLFGYCLLVLAAWHLWFQAPILAAFFRRISPAALLEADRRRFRPAVRVTLWVLALAIVAAAAAVVTIESLRPKPVIILPAIMKWNPHPQRIWIEHGRQKLTAADYIHRQSSFTRVSVLRSIPFVGQRADEFKEFPGKPWTQLPQPRARAGALDASFSQQTLADLLFYCYGVTEKRHYPGAVLHLRAAASAGALYPTDLYVLARAVEGLEPGLYYYHAARHALARVAGKEAMENVQRALAPANAAALADAPATIIFSVVFDRTVWKYNVRSYRYVTMDTGHAAGNLAQAAGAVGLPARWTPRFDDEQLTRALGANPQQEGALLVAILGARPALPAQLPAHAPPAMPRQPGKLELTRLSHLVTSWRWVAGEPRHLPAPEPVAEPAAKAELLKLPEGSATGRDIFEVIRARRSFREYADRAVSQEDFAGLLRDAVRWPAEWPGSELLRLYVLVRKVEGVAAGAYRYRPGEHELELIARGDVSGKVYSAGLWQELLSRAAFVLVWTIDIEGVGRRDGERDYRHGCLAAGMGGQNAYLAAVARGLGVCGVGAFFDGEVDELLRLGGAPHRSLYLMGVGAQS